MESVIIYTRERGNAPADLPFCNQIRDVAFHDIAISPTRPLEVGLRVRIHVLRPRHGREVLAEDPDDPHTTPRYRAESADIAGPIVGIRTLELAVTEFIVQNEIYRSTVEHAYLSVPHLHGLTVRLGMWHWIARTVLLPLLPHTRHVRLQDNAVITHRAYRIPGEDYGPLASGEELDEEDE
ncbi:uncharacterized protein TRAVEDRAFT_47713 [Trametes versicolor FP-101664 SS1]|uniref:uncharacterized protein n=1 Tax=Trametes versicolor (strain FP-101664) TaxID=717944 RepID=UPI0004621A13|nr:uncharacterized protein TRAVEDRAFT_47713 [Trametes versicolor FP-101664 SS1]EIW58572.1 hypothetical protein TRAVEDRAFT_47713 [Trametes versicolor FP-101664 SS1]